MSSETIHSGVSCEPCAWMLAWLEAAGGSAEDWILDLPVRSEEIRGPKGRLHWDVFLGLCARIATVHKAQLGSADSQREIGREIGDRLFSQREFAEHIDGLEWSQLYTRHTAAICQSLFAGLAHHVEELASGRLALHLDLPADLADGRPFFELVAGVLERAPMGLGLAPALVAAKLSRGSARYTLRMPAAEAGRTKTARAQGIASIPWVEGPAASRDSGDRLRKLLENVEEVVCEVTPDGMLRYVSPSVRELLGYSPEHFTGKSFVEFLLPQERPAMLERFAKMLRSGSARVTFQAPRSDGTRCWLEASARPFQDAQQQLRIAAVLRDVTEQTESERSLRASEERYRDVVENSADLMGVCDPSGRLRAASPVLTRFLAASSPEDSGLELTRFVQPEDWLELAQAFSASAKSGEPGALDLRIRQPDSEARWFDVRWSPFRGRSDEPLLSLVMRDIDARRQEEESLRAIAEGLFSSDAPPLLALVEHLAGALQCDMAFVAGFSESEAGAARTSAVWSDGAPAENFEYSLAGTPCERVLGGDLCCYPSGVQQLYPADDDLVRRRIQGYVGAPLRGSNGQLLGLLVALSREPIQDPERARSLISILGNRAAQELEHEDRVTTLQHSRARVEMLASNPYDLISEIAEDRRLLYVSPNFKQILGRDPEEFIGRDFLELVHPHDRAAAERAFPNILDSDRRGLAPYRLLRGDESACWVETAGSGYRNATGERIVVFISRDVSERVESSRARERAEREALQEEKLESIGRLAGGVAHDFNNLLTAIIGYADLLAEAESDTPSRHDAQEILNAAKRGEMLTRQLLAFSRRQVMQPTRVDVNALVASLDRMLRRLIGNGVEVSTRLDGDVWNVRADPNQLEQVILNLAVNARDAMKTGGRIEIATSNVEISEAAGSKHLPAGRYASIAVADCGAGMDPATVARVFEPFFTTKNRDQGSGLGLSMAYGIVRQSGGYITVESQLGAGTQFQIFLPRIESEAEPDRRRSQLERYRGDETILVVEDSDPVRLLVERHLRRLGYSVLSAPEWSEALAHCEHHSDPIHLLLTDLILPNVDGFELARRARELRPELRVVYMSGFSGDLVDDPERRGEDFVLLEKPFTPSSLLSVVRECLDAPAP